MVFEGSSLARSEVPSIFLRFEGDLLRFKRSFLLERGSLLLPRIIWAGVGWGGTLFLFWNMRWGIFLFCLKTGGRTRFLSLKVRGGSFFLSVCSLASVENVKGAVRISFLYLKRKEVSSCRLRGKQSCLLSWSWRGLSALLRWSSLSCKEWEPIIPLQMS